MAEQDVWHTRGCQCQRRTQNLICVNLTKTFLNANLHFNQTSMHSEVLNFGQYIWICFYFNPTTFLLLLLLFVFLIVSCVCKNLHFDFMIIYLASKKKKKNPHSKPIELPKAYSMVLGTCKSSADTDGRLHLTSGNCKWNWEREHFLTRHSRALPGLFPFYYIVTSKWISVLSWCRTDHLFIRKSSHSF